jgi:AraC-like DNA-binding protein
LVLHELLSFLIKRKVKQFVQKKNFQLASQKIANRTGMEFNSSSVLNILVIFILTIFTLLLFNVGRHSKSNIYLGYYFISQILALVNITFSPLPVILHSLLHSIVYSWGALFYLFVCSILNLNFQFKPKTLLHFIPTLAIALFLISSTEPNLSQHFQQHAPLLFLYRFSLLKTLFNVIIVGYNIATIFIYYKYKAQVKKNPKLKIKVPTIWLNIAIWGFVFACLLTQIGNYLGQKLPANQFNWEIIGISAFLIYFSILFYVSIANHTLTEISKEREKYKNSSLSKTDALQLLSQLENYMDTHKPFVNPELKMKDIAEWLDTSERNLSQLVNEYKNQNFSDFINSYRIKYAISLLTDPLFKEKTILWILFESGFNSKTSFNTTFKKATGFTPAEYRKTH